MDNTIMMQGNFTSTGKTVNLSIPSGADWIRVYNFTALDQAAADLPFEFYWQLGMDPGGGIAWTKDALTSAEESVTVGALTVGAGFLPLNQGYNSGISAQVRNSTQVSKPVAFSATSNNVNPQITTTSILASGVVLETGDVVRLSQDSGSIDANDLLGIDFQITVDNDTHFTITNALSQAPGAGGTNGFWRKVTVGNTFYPEFRYIVDIAAGLTTLITTSVDHGYLVGQLVTFNITSTLNGMTQLNQLTGPILSIFSASSFEVDIDTSSFTPFQFPTIAAVAAINNAYTPATVVPAGMDTATALDAIPVANILSDATRNQLIIGMSLLGANIAANGAAGPAGAVGDSMFWQAGTVYLNING